MNRNSLRGWSLALVVVGLLSFHGCGNNSGRPPVEIHGVVKFNGEPLEEGSIHFTSPKTGESAGVNIGQAGTYQVKFNEADIGEAYEVSIGQTIVDQTGIPASELQPPPPLKAKIPRRYMARNTSKLTAAVKAPGKNQVDFDLTSK
ncbi:hypothetical protein [Planctomicrobium sp. SH527]|uniref:hypothetical protein n=1 Tax=Planctomicrobium sp. SH527 TaxID=3448123 RepID=UPI003F5C6CD8